MRIRRWGLVAMAGGLSAIVGATAVQARPSGSDQGVVFGSAGLPLLGPLHHGGRWLLDDRGRVVIPHGVMDYTPASRDIPFLASHGFTIVRAAFHMSEVEPKPGVFDDTSLAVLKSGIDALGVQGIDTLLDSHEDGYGPGLGPDGMPAWMQDTKPSLNSSSQSSGIAVTVPGLVPAFPVDNFADPATNIAWQNLWHDAALPNGVVFTSGSGVPISHLQEAYADMWRHVASYFAGDPYLYGYDLLNEPWAGADWPYPTCETTGCPDFERMYLSSFDKKVVAAVHSVDPLTITSYEPSVQASTGGTPIYLGSDAHNADANSSINFHPYCLSGLWGAPGFSAGAVIPDPAEDAVCNHNIDGAFAAADAQSQAACGSMLPGQYCDPPFISEFGASQYNDETEHVLTRADQYMMPWSFFEIGLAESPSPIALTQIINVVDRPYPYAVAGTPQSYQFSDGYRLDDGALCPSYLLAGTPACPATHLFRLDYATAAYQGHRVSGPTLVYVPALQYPKGYSVAVTGATVLSAPNAGWLELAALPCAAGVHLALAPSGSPLPSLEGPTTCR